VASGHTVLSRREIEGVTLRAEVTSAGIEARLRVAEGARIATPVHLCFGVVEPAGTQRLRIAIAVEPRAAVTLLAHCFFPRAEDVRHLMDATIEVGEGARATYLEGHYHGRLGGVAVRPRAQVRVGPGARYASDFALTAGRVGRLEIDYAVDAAEDAVAELTARVSGRGADRIKIKEALALGGRGARGIIKTRIALGDEASAEVVNVIEGRAEGARGHMDCLEIVRDRAVASAVPLARVVHPLAKVTHEAAIGTVDRKQLETLMARGLTPDEAVDMIVKGVLR
jgi:hypothetical protein